MRQTGAGRYGDGLFLSICFAYFFINGKSKRENMGRRKGNWNPEAIIR
jgi:hypothetical protein